MYIKKLIPIIALLLASLACSVLQEATPEVKTATLAPTQTEALPTATFESATSEADTEAELPQTEEAASTESAVLFYPIVDTRQVYCYPADGSSTPCPEADQAAYGQDAQYAGNMPSYTDNGDGTISDNVTGLMWQQDPGEKMSYEQVVAGAESFNLAGYDDWRLPTIKELYSLILFSGVDPSGYNGADTSGLVPFIDEVFAFEYGDTDAGERIIDSQFATSTKYVSTTMGNNDTDFGVNFADGRIKGYPTGPMPGQSSGKLFFVLYVRGNTGYGINDFVDNGDGTIRDNATNLTWMQTDSGTAFEWEVALNYCESLDYAGISNWRLPNIKELQSIVDYSRSPDTSNSAAIDPLFHVTPTINEAEQTDYHFYWSSTTHANMVSGMNAAYVAFGRAMGNMNGQWLDVHGAGAQRSDPKSGNPADWPTGHGPQGDAIHIFNYVRCVSGGVSDEIFTGGEIDPNVNATPSGTTPPGASTGQGELPTPSQGGGQQGNPPQEAINACAGLSAGAACSFTTLIGTINGGCTQIQTQPLSILACVPKP